MQKLFWTILNRKVWRFNMSIDGKARKAAIEAIKENYGHCPYEIGVF